MKTLLLTLSLMTCIWSCSQGQSLVTLKNGNKIEGKIISLVNDTLTINFNGNIIKLKQSNIESIIMDKNTVTVSTNTNATLKGVVTYFFNDNYGDKPDVGAKVYLRKTDTTNRKMSILFNYQLAKFCKYLWKIEKDEKHLKTLQKLNADTKKGFDKLDSLASNEVLNLDLGITDAIKTTVDGNGNYSLNAEPGLYEIIFISKGRSAPSQTEIMGQIETKIIFLKAGEIAVSDVRFSIY